MLLARISISFSISQSIPASGFGLDSDILMSLAVLRVAIQVFKGLFWPDHHIVEPSNSVVKSSFFAYSRVDYFNFDCIWGKLKGHYGWNLHILGCDLGVICLFYHTYTYDARGNYLQVDLLVMVRHQLLLSS